MYIYEISISVNAAKNLPEAFEQFSLLTASYRGSGQILGRNTTRYISGLRIIELVHCHETTSLEVQNDNFYVNLRKGLLEELCEAKVEYKLLQESTQDASVCQCAKSDFYLLITEELSIYSPVKCGTCFETVPLYKLPAYFDNGYMPILNWESDYQACDTLQMNGRTGEVWAINQMENPNAELATQGREVCAGIEQNTNTPTYYFIPNSKVTTVEEELDSVCPACKQEWLLTQPLAGGIFPFKCDNCRLISTFSSNILE